MQFFPFFVHSRIFYFPRFFNGGKTGGRFFFVLFILSSCSSVFFFILKKVTSHRFHQRKMEIAWLYGKLSLLFFLFHPSKLIQKEKNKKGKEKEKEKKKELLFFFSLLSVSEFFMPFPLKNIKNTGSSREEGRIRYTGMVYQTKLVRVYLIFTFELIK